MTTGTASNKLEADDIMMRMARAGVFLIVFAGLAVAGAVAAEPAAYWPQWRGPDGTGVGKATHIPDEWSATKNVKWKVPIDGLGHSTPIIWGDRVFLLTAIDTKKKGTPEAVPTPSPQRGEGHGEGRPRGRGRGPGGFRGRGGGGRSFHGGSTPTTVHKFALLCLDRRTGRTLWERTAVDEVPHEGHHGRFGSFASGSPATDGTHVYANFGSRGLYCYDMDGNLQWKKNLDKMSTAMAFGEGVSPVVYGDSLVVQHDHQGQSYITVLDKSTGRTRWKADRDDPTTWATPTVVDVNGHPQVVAAGTPMIRAYDLATGEERWRCSGMTRNAIPTLVAGHGMVYATSGFRGNALRAIRLGNTGDLTDDPKAIAWSLDRGTPYVPSPLLYGDELYLLRDRGMVSCYDAKTGKPHYEATRIPGVSRVQFHASPVGADGKIYCLSLDGTCVVLERGTTMKVIAINKIDEWFSASPAVAAGDLFLRGDKHLYCIGTN